MKRIMFLKRNQNKMINKTRKFDNQETKKKTNNLMLLVKDIVKSILSLCIDLNCNYYYCY